jgi:shikimate dehydrogenase
MTVRRAAVLGSPIAHSLSPALHRAAYAALGLSWIYNAVEVGEDDLPAFFETLDSTWAGLSITSPLKQAVIPLLSRVDARARAVGAVNTVLPIDGGWRGANTDIDGVVQSVSRVQSHPPVTASVLGAGATARSVLAAMRELGVTEVTVCARRVESAVECCALAERLGMVARSGDLEPRPDIVDVDLFVSTLPERGAAPWRETAATARGTLLDVAYHPWPTPLSSVWPTSAVASGRDMLLWQAVEQVRLMTGLEPPVAAMAAALPAL